MNVNTSENIFDNMLRRWPSGVVAQAKVCEFTGGIITGKRLANLASLGERVPPSIKVGNRRAYDAEGLVNWLRDRQAP